MCLDGTNCDSGICEDGICCAVQCGPCGSCDAAGTACSTTEAQGTPCGTPPVTDDFESGGAKWSLQSGWTLSAPPTETSTGLYTEAVAGGGAWSATLLSNVELAPAPYSPSITYRHAYWLNSEVGYVEISTDGGSGWALLEFESNSALGPHTISLDAYRGQTVSIRFRLNNGFDVNTNGFWYIDDFALHSGWPEYCAACDDAGACTNPTADDPNCDVDCDGLDGDCRDYDDITTGRCEGFDDCKDANTTADCTAFTDASQGSTCGGEPGASYGFETGTADWTLGPNWSVSTQYPHSGSYSLEADCLAVTNDNAIVGPFLLGTGAQISFWHYLSALTTNVFLSVSADSGQTWTGIGSWTGNISNVQVTKALDAFAGQRVHFRFSGGCMLWWNIDDVVIDAGGPAVCAECDGAGSCIAPADDPACGDIDCDLLDETCLDRHDLTANRCSNQPGRCKVPNNTFTCTDTTPAPAATDCGLCAECDGSGSCVAAADDDACGTIECDGMDASCRDYDDLVANRCEGIGDCKDSNTNDCDQYSDASALQPCTPLVLSDSFEGPGPILPWKYYGTITGASGAGHPDGSYSLILSASSQATPQARLSIRTNLQSAGSASLFFWDRGQSWQFTTYRVDATTDDWQTSTTIYSGSVLSSWQPHAVNIPDNLKVAGLEIAFVLTNNDILSAEWELDIVRLTNGYSSDLCLVCDGSGGCGNTPPDDVRCPNVECDTFDGPCRDYDDLTTNRCKSPGVCRVSNPFDCNQFTDAPSGTSCTTCGECDGGGGCSVVKADDPACPVVDCDVYDSSCRDYDDLTTNRCASVGSCKSTSSSTCTVFTPAAAGTSCGTCRACDAVGDCTQTPATDAACTTTVDCDVLDRGCRDYDDVTFDTCTSFGNCYAPSESDCTTFTDANAGTLCGFPPLFTDDFESGNTGWTLTAPGAWQVGAAAHYQSANQALFVDMSTTTTSRTDVAVLNQTFDFSTAISPRIDYWQWYSSLDDGGYVDVSTNGGSTWSPIVTSLDAAFGASGAVVSQSLHAFVGQPSVKIRFRRRLPVWEYAAWYIDDVSVHEETGSPEEPCWACDGAGACNTVPPDDPNCGDIDCNALDGPCGDFDVLTTNRCEGAGDCKDVEIADCPAVSVSPAGTDCGACAECDGAGDCSVAPADDDDCGVIGCDAALTTACRAYSDLTTDRCEGFGDCKEVADCNAYVDAPSGTDCGTCSECDGAGICDLVPSGTPCDLCMECDASGACNTPAVDDSTCGTIDCSSLDTQCRTYDDITVDRCEAGLTCKSANDPTACTSYTDLSGPCDDGNACTQGDTCQGGTCAPTSVLACAPLDQCHVAGSCDPLTGTCSNPPAPNGTACDDGRACTSGDSCQAGVCVPTANACACSSDADCKPLDQCHVAGSCETNTGICTTPPAADGTPCDDASACTTGETCQSGVCGAPTSTVTCTALDQCHVPGTCDPTTGVCSDPPAPDDAVCDDGRSCTTGDSCQSGACVPSTNACACSVDGDCTPLDQCHAAGVCDSVTGTCTSPPLGDGTPCDDASACTTGETCQSGVCGAPTSTVTCSALDQCHVAGTCDPGSGVCSNPAKADGSTCDDGRSCTTGDGCQAGSCVPSQDGCACSVDADCTPLDQCHLAGTCTPSTGTCSSPPVADGTLCDDADACTLGETCQAGACGSPLAVTPCFAFDECHVAGACDPATGTCPNPSAPDGTPCSVGVCLGGACGSAPSPGADAGADAAADGAAGNAGSAEASVGTGGAPMLGDGSSMGGNLDGSSGLPAWDASAGGSSAGGRANGGGTANAGSTGDGGSGTNRGGQSSADLDGAIPTDSGSDSFTSFGKDEGSCACRVRRRGTDDSRTLLAVALLFFLRLRRRDRNLPAR